MMLIISVSDNLPEICLLGARDGSVLEPAELSAQVDAEVDSIIRAVRVTSESESGLLLHSACCCRQDGC